MATRRPRKTKQPPPPRHSKRKALTVLALALSLAVSGVILAQRGRQSTRTAPAQQQERAITPLSLDAGSPANEFIYAGGRLIATESPASQSCSYALSPTSQNFPAGGGTSSVNVTTSTGCTWTATSNSSWITITSGASGSGNGTVNYSVTANPGASQRVGSMTVAGINFPVTQDGSTSATNAAAFISQSVPTTLTTGQVTSVSVTMQNSGTTTWTQGTYKLGSQNPADNVTWGLNRVELPFSVTPGAQVTFSFNITAPSTAGAYNFQWRMHDGTAFFGALTTNVPISVTGGGGGSGDNAQFYSQSVPSTMSPGASYQVTVKMTNNGSTTWSSYSTYKLGSQNPQDNTTWGLNRVTLKSTVLPGSVATFKFNVTAPSSSGTYNFQWRMINGTTWFGGYTTNVVVTVGSGGQTPPAAPSNLTATAASSSQINLIWTDNSNNEESFKIERSSDGGSSFGEIATVGAGVTTYSNTGLLASTTYSYRVRAYNSAGYSAYSNTASATTSGATQPPAAPSDLTATAQSSTQVSLNWLDNSGNESGFRIERSSGGSDFSDIGGVGAGVTSYLDTTVSASTSYSYRVKAYNSAGDSPFSNIATVTTPGGGSPPTAPSNLIATAASSSQINLTWTDNSTNETGFSLERKTGASGAWGEITTRGADVTSYSDTNLSASTTYYYRVRAYNGAGYSASSNEAYATTSASGGGGCSQVTVLSGSGVYGYTEGTGAAAQWRAPVAGVVAIDPVSSVRSLFIADTENHRIRMVYLEGANAGLSVLLAGSGVAGLYDGGGDAYQARFRYPRGIAALTDSNGVVTMLIIADTENHMIRKLLPPLTVKWRVSALSNIYGGPGYVDGDAYQSKYNYPRAMVVSPDGSIYVADSANAAIRRLDQFGASTTLALITDQDLPVTPVGITVSQTTWNLYVTSWIPSKLWRVTNSGQFSFVAGSYTAGYADGVGSAAMFNWPWYLGWRSSAGAEELFIADTDNQRIRKVVISTATVSTHAGTGVAGFADGACSTAQFNYPKGVALGVSGELYLVDSGNNRIRKVQ